MALKTCDGGIRIYENYELVKTYKLDHSCHSPFFGPGGLVLHCNGETNTIQGPGIDINLWEIVSHHACKLNSWEVFYYAQTREYYVSSVCGGAIDVLDSNLKPVRKLTGCAHAVSSVVTDGRTLVAWLGVNLSILSDGVWRKVPHIRCASGAGFSSDGRIFVSDYNRRAIHVCDLDGHWSKIDLSFRPGSMVVANDQLIILDNDINNNKDRVAMNLDRNLFDKEIHKKDTDVLYVMDLDRTTLNSFSIPDSVSVAVMFQK